MKRKIGMLLILCASFVIGAQGQMCGNWEVYLTIIDRDRRGVVDASVKFINSAENDATSGKAFYKFLPDGNVYLVRFAEGENVARQSGGTDYDVLISAPGYRDLETTVHIDYCRQTTQTSVLDRRQK